MIVRFYKMTLLMNLPRIKTYQSLGQQDIK